MPKDRLFWDVARDFVFPADHPERPGEINMAAYMDYIKDLISTAQGAKDSPAKQEESQIEQLRLELTETKNKLAQIERVISGASIIRNPEPLKEEINKAPFIGEEW